MNRQEYNRLQRILSEKIEENLWCKYGYSGRRAEGYKQGILVAKSVLHDEFERQQHKKDKGDQK